MGIRTLSFYPQLMHLLAIFLLAFLASTLTFFSGFGLGTLLLPAFLILHPDRPHEAVLAVALVHLTNNLLKGGLTFRWLEVRPALYFGLSSAGAAAAGAWALESLNGELAQRAIGCTLLIFALFEFLPTKGTEQSWATRPSGWFLGGLLSGFAGGFSGHQGALRSFFLSRTGWSAQQVVATGTAVALAVDLSRIPLYLWRGDQLHADWWPVVAFGALGALLGSLLGRRFLPKLTLRPLQIFVALGLTLLGARLLWLSYL